MSAENKNEAVALSDVSTRISQQLAELDEAYLHRAEKHIELLLAEKAAETGDAEAEWTSVHRVGHRAGGDAEHLPARAQLPC